MTKEELIEMFYDNISCSDWEKYDFVDPPYCWCIGASIEVDGYLFEADGMFTYPDIYEAQTIDVTTPTGEVISLM